MAPKRPHTLRQSLGKVLGLPIHPVLFAIFAVTFLVAQNIREVDLEQVIRPLLIAGIGTLLLLLVLARFFRERDMAAFLLSVGVLLFFSYGHLYTAFEDTTIFAINIGRHRTLIAVLSMIIAFAFILVRRKSVAVSSLTVPLNMIALVLLIGQLLPLIEFSIDSIRAKTEWESVQNTSDRISADQGLQIERPDIYYIILDAYARPDFMMSKYDLDVQEFVNELEDQGFYVAEESNSNFLWTGLSITSSLNMDYLQNLDIDIENRGYPTAIREPLRNSEARTQLENLGYAVVALQSLYPSSNIKDATEYIEWEVSDSSSQQSALSLSGFDNMLASTTLLRIPLDLRLSDQLDEPFFRRRIQILSTFDHLKETTSISSPKFVFVHIVAPHGPYVFGPNGEYVDQNTPFTLEETSGNYESKVLRYKGQVEFMNQKLIETIDFILQNSESPPVIILQSDHGAALGGKWLEHESSDLMSRSAILNAYLFPNGCESELYPTITPVNSFRILFNCYFDQTYSLLEDKTYFSNVKSDNPGEFIPLDELLNTQ